MKKQEEITEGWKILLNGNEHWHYFRDGKSLCRRWMCLSNGGLEQGNNKSPDNCKSCMKKLLKEKENEPNT